MLQYILNATAIWLLSLLMYDLLLRREPFHNYNRFYLVFTFLLGALFPLIQIEDYTALYSDTNAVQQVITAKQNIVAAATAKNVGMDWQQWLWIVYLTGVVVSSTLLVAEIIKLVRLYRKGNKNGDGIFIVIETGKEYAPFSIFNLLFINTRKQYNMEEWEIIIAHERQHTRLVHFMDMLLMQCGRIVFWFHPLVYIYNKRLLMVHEYQADSISKQAPQEYGHFLIEQSILASAPALSHSFNRSPIKNRIVMLTRNSSRAAHIKTLVFVPVMLTCIICFARDNASHKKERNGDIVTYKGNKFELNKALPPDTAYVEDPVTKEMQMKIMRMEQHPIKVNGAKIYSMEEVNSMPRLKGKENTLREYLQNQLQEELSQLPDGKYNLSINYIVTGADGKIAYYDFDGIRSRNSVASSRLQSMPEKLAKDINTHVEQIMDKISVISAKYNGKNVPCLTNSGKIFDCSTPIEVKNHEISWLDHY